MRGLHNYSINTTRLLGLLGSLSSMPLRFSITFATMIGIWSLPYVAEARYSEVIRSVAENGQARQSKTNESLIGSDGKAIPDQDERAVFLFSRGLSLFDSSPEEARTNFESAQKLLSPNNPLYGLVSVYHGRAVLNKKNARAVLAKLNAMTKNNINRSPHWRPEKFALMIEIIMVLEQDRMLVKTWNDMSARVKPAMRDQRLTQKVTAYLERRQIDTRPDLWPLVEAMAGEYPHSEGGRWAFQKLQKLADLKTRPYVYSISLINRLSSNTNLDDGLKYFLIELTKGPVRRLSGKVETMEDFERMTYLFQNRFWNESRRLVETHVDDLKVRQNQSGRIQHAKALNLLAQIQSRQGDFEQAARTWSIYIASFQDVVDTRVAVEGLADSLVRLRLHREAAKIYESLAKSASADPVIRWHHFWNLYLAQEYASALVLLDRGNYVPHRDRGIEGGLDYWRARILEKQGKQTDALEIYKKILSQNGDGFYSAITQARHPRLLESVRRSIDPSVTLSKAPFDNSSTLAVNFSENVTSDVSASQVGEGLGGIPNNVTSGSGESRSVYQSYMKTAAALGKWGRKQIGRRLLRLVPTAEKKGGAGAWVESFRLAVDLKDYSYGFKAPQMVDSPLRRIPSSLADLEVHMLRFNPDWKLMYPYAFREIIEPVSKAADVDPFLLLSLMRAESVYDEDAQSHVGAQGLMQIMPFTAVRLARVMRDSDFELSELRHPEINISYAAFYVRMLADYYKGNTILAVAAYNGGPASVDRWLSNYGDLEMDELVESMTFRETRRYVKSVFRNLGYYKFIWQQSRALAYLPKVPSETAGGEIF